MFSKETYIQRREKLKKNFDNGTILFLGNDECGMNYADNTYHFRQDSTFLYYFGINAPGLYAILDLDMGNDIIFGNDYTIDDIVWMGDMPSVASLAEKCGIGKTAGVDALKQTLEKSGQLIFLPPYRPEHPVSYTHLTLPTN